MDLDGHNAMVPGTPVLTGAPMGRARPFGTADTSWIPPLGAWRP